MAKNTTKSEDTQTSKVVEKPIPKKAPEKVSGTAAKTSSPKVESKSAPSKSEPANSSSAKPVPVKSETITAKAMEDVQLGVTAAKTAVSHVGQALELGYKALPEVVDTAKTLLDRSVEKLKTEGQEVAEVALDHAHAVGEKISEQVKASPVKSLLTALGLGFVLRSLFSGRKKSSS